MTLSLIRDTVQQAAQAITAALDLETEIVDESLKIIGGTGRYAEKSDLTKKTGTSIPPLFTQAVCEMAGNTLPLNQVRKPFTQRRKKKWRKSAVRSKSNRKQSALSG